MSGDSQGDVSRAEVTLGVLGALVAVAVIAFFLWQGLASPGTPPRLEVELLQVTPAGPGYRADVRVTNSGGATAAGAVVEGMVLRDGRTVATSTVTIDYVPSESSAEAALIFPVDPRPLELQLQAVGYTTP